jgi:hypothetical protein
MFLTSLDTFSRAATWVAFEVVLGLMGLDTLADYSEFIFVKEAQFEQHAIAVELSAADFCIEHPLCSL